jgi:hypothetical protein
LYNENEQVLIIAKYIKEYAAKFGHEVILSREANVNITSKISKGGGKYWSQPDSNMIASANKCKAGNYDLMVSLHLNSSENEKAYGVQLYYKTGNGVAEESKMLADTLADSMKSVVDINSVSTRFSSNGQDYYGCLRMHDKIGVLIEALFMSNESDMKILVKNQKAIGQSIAVAIDNYLKKIAGVEDYEVFTAPKVVCESRLKIDNVSYLCTIYDSKKVELMVSKDVNVVTKYKSGGLYWNSALDQGTARISYYAMSPTSNLVKFGFDEIVGVANGERFTKSNAITYSGAVTNDSIQAWYIARGTSTNVIGKTTITITGYVDDETYAKLTK